MARLLFRLHIFLKIIPRSFAMQGGSAAINPGELIRCWFRSSHNAAGFFGRID